MIKRILTNFSPGPAALPQVVIDRLQEDLANFRGVGYSIMEASHRSTLYKELHNSVLEKIRKILRVPSSHTILLLAGGATLQFAMVPYNLGSGAYVVAGQWGLKAFESAQQVGKMRIVYNGATDQWQRLPTENALRERASDNYLHLTSNETINGLQWHSWPSSADLPPLVADMSSDIMSRPLPVERFALIYASAQKNMGIAGVTVVILNPDLLSEEPALPPYLDYRQHIRANSLYNTPPTIAIYTLGLVMDWIAERGGLTFMQEQSRRRSSKLYAALDALDGFYHNSIAQDFRSEINVIFTLPNEVLTARFLEAATQEQLVGLPGHRSVGGCRVSLYNAIEEQAVDTLIDFMRDFARKNG